MLSFFLFSPPSDAYLVVQPTSPPPSKRQAHSLKAVTRIDGSHHETILLNRGISCPETPLLAKALEVRPTVLPATSLDRGHDILLVSPMKSSPSTAHER